MAKFELCDCKANHIAWWFTENATIICVHETNICILNKNSVALAARFPQVMSLLTRCISSSRGIRQNEGYKNSIARRSRGRDPSEIEGAKAHKDGKKWLSQELGELKEGNGRLENNE